MMIYEKKKWYSISAKSHGISPTEDQGVPERVKEKFSSFFFFFFWGGGGRGRGEGRRKVDFKRRNPAVQME